jgi:hypothetical protein
MTSTGAFALISAAAMHSVDKTEISMLRSLISSIDNAGLIGPISGARSDLPSELEERVRIVDRSSSRECRRKAFRRSLPWTFARPGSGGEFPESCSLKRIETEVGVETSRIDIEQEASDHRGRQV